MLKKALAKLLSILSRKYYHIVVIYWGFFRWAYDAERRHACSSGRLWNFQRIGFFKMISLFVYVDK